MPQTPIPPPLLLSSLARVMTILASVAPIGCNPEYFTLPLLALCRDVEWWSIPGVLSYLHLVF
jgi:hypothetical protein